MTEKIQIDIEGEIAETSIVKNLDYLTERFPSTPQSELGLCLLEIAMEQLSEFEYVELVNGDVYKFQKA